MKTKPEGRALVLALVLIPPLTYPLNVGLLVLHDSLLGDGTALALLSESPRATWNQFWGDWLRALPSLYVLNLLWWIPVILLLSRAGVAAPWVYSLAGSVAGAWLGLWLAGGFTDAAVAMALCGAGNGAAVGLVTRRRGG